MEHNLKTDPAELIAPGPFESNMIYFFRLKLERTISIGTTSWLREISIGP